MTLETEETRLTARASPPVDWDYTDLAASYVHRPGYAPAAIDRLFDLVGPLATTVIDLGAGAGHLTAPLADRAAEVLALEPNQAMRRLGVIRTKSYANVRWMSGRMEETGLAAGSFSLATCGSSFGVADHTATLRESARLLTPAGWFACLWNHRDLQDALQDEIEAYIKRSIPEYRYGSRRDNQTPIIEASGLFVDVVFIERPILHRLASTAWIDAWRSHATLQRQAGARFGQIVDGIAAIVKGRAGDIVEVPYVTRLWAARRRDRPGG